MSVPRRCFLVNVPEIMMIQSNKSSSLRLMGLAVGWKKSELAEYTEITLDDGTALMVIQVPHYMIRTCQASSHQTFLGKLLDCIVRVVDQQQQQQSILQAEQISILEDDPHAELVRWFELSWQPSSQPNISMESGYPVPELTADDFLEIIQLDCSTADNNNLPPGVAMDDLAIFFQVDQGTVEEFLAELQITGQIYQNQQGNYLPL